MHVKLSNNSFVRILNQGKLGYIRNQLHNTDCMFNEVGADFLKEITRDSKSISSIVDHLLTIYEIEKDELTEKFTNFISELSKCGYVTIIDGKEDIGDEEFTYNINDPKTLAYKFDSEGIEGITSTQNYISQEFSNTPFLWSIQVEITGKCNERCVHCYIPNYCKDSGQDMPIHLFKHLIDEFVEMGGLHVTITGGEALMHKDFCEMLRYCREKDLEITLLSNLTRLTKETINAIKKYNVSMVNASLYSIDDSIHDSITRIKGSCKKTKNAIEELVRNDIPVQISCPVLQLNKNVVDDVILYAKSLKTKANVDYNIVAQKDFGTQNLNYRLSLGEMEGVIKQIITNREDYVRFLEETPLDSSKEDDDAHPCGAAFSILSITSNGDVNPCSTWGEVLGNVFKSPLREIWNNSERIKEIRKIRFADFPECQKCDDRDYCTTCMAKNYTEGGNPLKINPYFCKVSHINRSVVEEWKKRNDR